MATRFDEVNGYAVTSRLDEHVRHAIRHELHAGLALQISDVEHKTRRVIGLLQGAAGSTWAPGGLMRREQLQDLQIALHALAVNALALEAVYLVVEEQEDKATAAAAAAEAVPDAAPGAVVVEDCKRVEACALAAGHSGACLVPTTIPRCGLLAGEAERCVLVANHRGACRTQGQADAERDRKADSEEAF